MPITNTSCNISVPQMAPFRDVLVSLLSSHLNVCTTDVTYSHNMESYEIQALSKSNYIILQAHRQLYQTNLESGQLTKSSLEAPVLYTSDTAKINITSILQCLII